MTISTVQYFRDLLALDRRTLNDDLFAAFLEFVGTAFFILFALGGVQGANAAKLSDPNATSTLEQVMFISTSIGFSLLVSAWLFFRITGGLFNPNIAFALMLVGILKPQRFVLYAVAELIGSIAACAILRGLTGPLASNTFLAPGVSKAQGVFIEMFITSALVLAVLMLAAEKHLVTPFAPVGIGLTLFSCHLFAVYFTGAGMNTARSFGPAVISGFPYHSQWIYWVGPTLGALLAAAFYTMIKHYKYWRLNPDQAVTEEVKSPSDPVRAIATMAHTLKSPASRTSLQVNNPSRSPLTPVGEKPRVRTASVATAATGSTSLATSTNGAPAGAVTHNGVDPSGQQHQAVPASNGAPEYTTRGNGGSLV